MDNGIKCKFHGEIQDIRVLTFCPNLGKAHQLLRSILVGALPTIYILTFNFISMTLGFSVSLFLYVCYNTRESLFPESFLYKNCDKFYLNEIESIKQFRKSVCFTNIKQLFLSIIFHQCYSVTFLSDQH